MPHVNSSGGDDLASTDEVKVYKDEGEEEKRSSENLSEDKLGLVTESEEGKTSDIEGRAFASGEKSSANGPDGKTPDPLPDRLGPFGYPYISPYPLPNGASLPHGLGSKVLSPPPGLGFYMYNDHFAQPPPAHMGISSVHIDPKTGFARPMYALPPPGQFHHPLYGPELSQWFSPPSLLPPHPGLPGSHHHSGIPHPAIVTPGPKQDIHSLHNADNHRLAQYYPDHMENGSMSHPHHHNGVPSPEPKNKIPRVKKPLNAFMLFMKEMRQTVIEECTLKESAAINQILGRRWHALDRSEQAKYYDMARKEKELHQQLYPGWSARDNYATHNKKQVKKRKRDSVAGGGVMGGHIGGGGSYNSSGNTSNPDTYDRTRLPSGMPSQELAERKPYPYLSSPSFQSSMRASDLDLENSKGDCPNAKKCRARFGLEAQNQWCKPCRSGGLENGRGEHPLTPPAETHNSLPPPPKLHMGGGGQLGVEASPTPAAGPGPMALAVGGPAPPSSSSAPSRSTATDL